MKKNMGTTDRITRILFAAIITSLYFIQFISGTIAIIGLLLVFVLMLTAFIGFCPLYLPFGIHTNKKTENDTRN